MAGGYVLNFTDATFGQLFNRYKIKIHSIRYQDYGSSKAKKLRVRFGDKESRLL